MCWIKVHRSQARESRRTICTRSPPSRFSRARFEDSELPLSGVYVGRLREAVAGEIPPEPNRQVAELVEWQRSKQPARRAAHANEQPRGRSKRSMFSRFFPRAAPRKEACSRASFHEPPRVREVNPNCFILCATPMLERDAPRERGGPPTTTTPFCVSPHSPTPPTFSCLLESRYVCEVHSPARPNSVIWCVTPPTFSCLREPRRVCEVNHRTTLLISSTRRAHDRSRPGAAWEGSPEPSQPSVSRTTGASKLSSPPCPPAYIPRLRSPARIVSVSWKNRVCGRADARVWRRKAPLALFARHVVSLPRGRWCMADGAGLLDF